MRATYKHTNIIAMDWRLLSAFYQHVFGCVPVPPRRAQSGAWLEEGTGVRRAALEDEHLRLPGHGEGGPTLEIYSYREMLDAPEPAANRRGYGHLAFEVDDVEVALELAIAAGGRRHGKVVSQDVAGAGRVTFTYVQDPEGNLVELQSWLKS